MRYFEGIIVKKGWKERMKKGKNINEGCPLEQGAKGCQLRVMIL
jgi:hypothetical protein